MSANIKQLSESLWLQAYTNADGSTNKVLKLGDQARATLLTQAFSPSLFLETAKGTDISESNTLSVSFVKAQAGALLTKTELGTGSFNKWNQSESITINWQEPLVSKEALQAAAIAHGVPYSAADKLNKFMEQFYKKFERDGFELLEKTATTANKAITVNFNTITKEELYARIVQEATKLTQLKDKSEGIDLISPDKILIFVSPEILDKLALYGLVGNRADASFSGGQYSIGTLGGYRIFSNPYLKDSKVMITTDFTTGAGVKVIAAKAGNVDNLSEDQGVYFEATMAQGVIYKTTVTIIKQQ